MIFGKDRSRLPANINTTMEKLTFAERVIRMLAASADLKEAYTLLDSVLTVVREEAAAMQAAEQRFAKKMAKDRPITR